MNYSKYKYKKLILRKDQKPTFTSEIKHFIREIKHFIRNTENIPIYTKPLKYPEIYKQEVQKRMETMLKDVIMQHSYSSHSSPIWV